jgi:hypothetical protein
MWTRRLFDHTASGFVFEIMGLQPASGEWRGVYAMKRPFAAFKENFTFVCFDDDDKIERIVQYDDTKLVDDMTVRVATAKMKALERSGGSEAILDEAE